ncbi:hypothetical protein MtrunA17_Chr7g0245971 [Medicago truncatula]|uniref:Transmembrane protein, putative n=1 Tax=Medicago truncatula TaxID=3880 RepID=G7L0B0_MEDTR|nr:transmembrane protein, putative [Medicago truncatula]RHN46788.1 hypothetical protein MtrunA17_Chr7g0245971 [Medicago truncatula]
MACPFEPTSHQWRATFYVHQQTFNITTPISIACNQTHYSFTTHRHKIYAFTFPTLLGFLQVQTAGNNTISPFQVHPLTTKVCLFGILGYYLSFRAWICWPSYANHFSIIMTIFGSFSLASLVSMLLSDSCWYIKYLFYILLVVVELHQMVKILYDKCVRRSILCWRLWHTKSVLVLPITYMDLIETNGQ